MEKLLLTAKIPKGHDKLNSFNLRSDIEGAYIDGGNDMDERLQGLYLVPKGSISGDTESFAIDLEDEGGETIDTYLYSSGYEYTQDVVTLGLDIYTVDYDKKVLSIYWGGELFLRDLNEGDVGDFWHTLRSEIDNDLVKDISFHQEDETQEPTLALYGIKVVNGNDEIDTSDEYLIENYIQVGNPEKYFGSDMTLESNNFGSHMKTTIKKSVFIWWFFNSGADQEQEAVIKEIGMRVMNKLVIGDETGITAQELFDNCNTDIIPCELLEEFPDSFDPMMEVGEHEDITEVILIND